MTRSASADNDRHEGQARGKRRHQNRREAFLRSSLDELGSERNAFDILQVAIVAHEHDAVPRGDTEHRDEPDKRAE